MIVLAVLFGLGILVCPALGVRAVAEPGLFSIVGPVDHSAAERFFAALGGLPPFHLRVEADALPGGGAGMSTCDRTCCMASFSAMRRYSKLKPVISSS